MTLVIRILALSIAVGGTFAGNFVPKSLNSGAVLQGSGVPGPIPVCDPWGKETCSIRGGGTQ
jgi:hypothetical protein